MYTIKSKISADLLRGDIQICDCTARAQAKNRYYLYNYIDDYNDYLLISSLFFFLIHHSGSIFRFHVARFKLTNLRNSR